MTITWISFVFYQEKQQSTAVKTDKEIEDEKREGKERQQRNVINSQIRQNK